jgi:hypothetical protein
MRLLSLWMMLVLFGALSAGCAKAPIEQLQPDAIIARSADQMTSLRGFEFLIERSGESAFLDYEETISFRRAEGLFVSPDRAQVIVRVITPGLVTEVQIISIGDQQWETNLLTGEWQASDPRFSFNPSLLFHPDSGIPAILADGLQDATLVGIQELPEIPGKRLYAVTASLQGERAHQMTYGMIDRDPLQIRLWVDPDSFDLYRIILIDPLDPGEDEDTTWQIDFWNHGATFEINQPILRGE